MHAIINEWKKRKEKDHFDEGWYILYALIGIAIVLSAVVILCISGVI